MASQLENGSNTDLNPIGVETAIASHHENGSNINPNSTGVETHESEAEKFGSLDCAVPIEDVVEQINLLGSSFSIEENGDMDDSDSDSDSESESENSESESSSDSGSESSSSTSSGSSSDSDDAHDRDVEVEDGEISGSDVEKMFSWSVADDDVDHDNEDGDDDAGGGPISSKNELQNLPPVPPVNATLESHHQILPVGIVTSVLGAQVIVEGVEKHDPLNEGSILWLTESRKPLGLVDEIFGPVKNPYYVVRYNSESEVPAGIHGGTLISFVPEFADHVLNNKDLYKKGYDASGANDEELSDEMEFSDDEKESEYKRMQRTTKRSANDQNHGKKKNNRKKFSSIEHAAQTIPSAPDAPLLDHGNCPPSSGIGQGLLEGTTTVPLFPPLNTVPNFVTNGVWTNGIFPLQPQCGMLPNGFPTNGISWCPQNPQICPPLPMPGIPFQQQLHPNQGSLPTTMLPGMQPNMLAQSLYAAGLVGQNPTAFGMGPSFPQIQPPMSAPQQGFPSIEFQSDRNLNNLHFSNISGAPPQFHPRPSANRGSKTSHGAGRKGWRPAK